MEEEKKISNLAIHNSYTYLRFGTHTCRHCILAVRGKCDLWQKEIEVNGKLVKVGKDTQCPILEAYVTGVIQDIMALDHIRETDRLAVEQAGRVLGYICLANKYLSEVGLFTHPQGESLDAKPLMHTVERYEQMLNRILVNLGLTPASRIKLKLDKKGRKTLGELIHEAENAPK